MSIEIIIFFLALWGILLCKKIYNEKKTDGPLVCPLGADCGVIVTGKFSSFLGIGLEVWGGLYYFFILIAYTIFYTFNFSFEPNLSLIVVAISGLGFLMSLALTFIQAFVIKTWCTWCLTSAALSTAIFFLGLYSVII
jgi:uncharacterized membrane protein